MKKETTGPGRACRPCTGDYCYYYYCYYYYYYYYYYCYYYYCYRLLRRDFKRKRQALDGLVDAGSVEAALLRPALSQLNGGLAGCECDECVVFFRDAVIDGKDDW